jgi:DUF971 family protein
VSEKSGFTSVRLDGQAGMRNDRRVPTPTNIQCIGDLLAIRWDDESEDYLPMERLRAFSPSAEQQGERDLMGNQYGGSTQENFPGVTVTGWQPVGGYAIQLNFSDGHRTGLYTFGYLKKIAEVLGNGEA